MDKVQCFLVVDSGRDRLSLRRYVNSETKCSSPHGYHNASVDIGEGPDNGEAIDSSTTGPVKGYEEDKRWPTHCPCGYAFQPNNNWQVFRASIYRREETGEEWTQMELPAGAMYDAVWLRTRIVGWKTTGPDGLALHVVCPPGKNWGDHWHVDGPANNGPGWDRTGMVPNITATPSIQTPRYHGHLRNGVLERC